MDELRAPLNLALVGLVAVATIAGYLLVPAATSLPIRWGFDLSPTDYAPRNLALLQMPIATLLVWGAVMAFRRFGNPERAAGNARIMRIVLPLVTGLFALIQVAMIVSGLHA